MALPLNYHWRNLFVRKTTTIMTVLVITAVVGVFAYMLAFAQALDKSLAVASDDEKIIVLRNGATSESNSAIAVEDFSKLSQVTLAQRDPDTGQVLVSPEMMVQVSLPRVRDGGRTNANVAVRGVTLDAFKVHQNVHPLGRVFSMAEPEVIVGVAAAKQFQGLKIGDFIHLGSGNNREYKVVGQFSADAGPMESEIWGYLPSLMNAYNRDVYSSAGLRLTDPATKDEVIKQIAGPAIQMSATTETDYWMEQAEMMRLYLTIAGVLVVTMSLAAVFSIANTMFSVVAGRVRELAMLRTMGFSPGQIKLGLVLEAVMLSMLGGVLGCLCSWAWLEFVGNTKDMFGKTSFTVMAFEIHLSPLVMVAALGLVALVGVVGAWLPANRAAGTDLVTALREP